MCGNFLESLKISGKTNVYGLIGDPVDLSMSPIIQNVAFRETRLNAVYVPFRVKKCDLKGAVNGLVALGIRGFNVTAPHKVSIIRYLKRLNRNAANIQSVNTVINREGVLEGFNTDGLGALRAVRIEHLHDASVLLFGAGGAARAIAHAFTPEVKAVRIVNRTLSRAKELEHSLRRRFTKRLFSASLIDRRISEYVQSADVIINASSMGMNGKNKLPVKAEWFHSRHVVFDIVYNPVETDLLRLARRAGSVTVNGLEMLLNQGCGSFELWTGRKAPISEMRRVIYDELARSSV
jgi:shikimate dehydrogenase